MTKSPTRPIARFPPLRVWGTSDAGFPSGWRSPPAGECCSAFFPGVFPFLASLEEVSVNLPVAVLIWTMLYPMMVGVDVGALLPVGGKPKGLIVTLVVNGLIKPLSMAALGVLSSTTSSRG